MLRRYIGGKGIAGCYWSSVNATALMAIGGGAPKEAALEPNLLERVPLQLDRTCPFKSCCCSFTAGVSGCVSHLQEIC